jgi:hypothetical protein
MVPMVEMTDAARTVMGPDHPAGARVIIIGRRIIGRPIEAAVEMMPVSVTAVAAAVERDTATMETAAMKATTVEATAAVEPASMSAAAAMTTSPMSSTPMTASATDLRRQCIGRVLRRGCGSRIDQRHRRRALTRYDCQHQHRGSSKAPAANTAAPTIQNFHHVRGLPEWATKAKATQWPTPGAFICDRPQLEPSEDDVNAP